MLNRNDGFLQKVWSVVPKRPLELLVFWLFLHSMVGTKLLNRRNPYKDRAFSLEEVARGSYLGVWPTILYSLALWGLISVLVAYCLMGLN